MNKQTLDNNERYANRIHEMNNMVRNFLTDGEEALANKIFDELGDLIKRGPVSQDEYIKSITEENV